MVGGGMIGAETAIYLARKGHRVVLVSRRSRMLNDAYGVNRDFLFKMMVESQVEVRTGTHVLRGSGDGVVVVQDGVEGAVGVDSVVFCRDMRSWSGLHRSLEGKVASLHAVGDCVEPRRLIDAIWQSFHTARRLGA